MQLAGVDITKETMEVGPTAHYMNGGILVDAETAHTEVPGLFAAGEVAGGLHGSNRLGGNSLSDLLVFGRRAGLHASEYVTSVQSLPQPGKVQIEELMKECLAPFEKTGEENPYTIHHELQKTMQGLVGIMRTESELKQAVDEISKFKKRARAVHISGNRQYNPGWHMALDLYSLLNVSEAVARAALERKESRGGHARLDFPKMDPNFGKINIVVRKKGNDISTQSRSIPPMPDELKQILNEEVKTNA
jgi:succinate dehydrogenase / fumarate reductase flavoprotein subunit